jgi:hypothetical protein
MAGVSEKCDRLAVSKGDRLASNQFPSIFLRMNFSREQKQTQGK